MGKSFLFSFNVFEASFDRSIGWLIVGRVWLVRSRRREADALHKDTLYDRHPVSWIRYYPACAIRHSVISLTMYSMSKLLARYWRYCRNR